MTRRVRGPSLAAQEARIRAADAINKQRANPTWSLTRAAKEAHTTPATVRRYLPGALTKDERGRWRAKASDRERFTMRVVSVEQDVVAVTVAGSKKRSLLGAHHTAIGTYLRNGDTTGLDALTGQKVAGLTLQTDPTVIRELLRQGQLSFLEIYALTR